MSTWKISKFITRDKQLSVSDLTKLYEACYAEMQTADDVTLSSNCWSELLKTFTFYSFITLDDP